MSVRWGTDQSVHLGGYIPVLLGCHINDAERIAERIRTEVEASRPGHLHLTASCGLSWASPGQQASMQQLLQQADEALYEAKDTGRNRVCLAA